MLNPILGAAAPKSPVALLLLALVGVSANSAGAAPIATIYSTVSNPTNPAQIAFANPVCNILFVNSPASFSPCGMSNSFGAVVTSQINVATGGLTTFFVGSDDGSYLYVDGTLVVNNGFFQGFVERSGSINLTPGLHTLTVQYFQVGGNTGLSVRLPSGVTYADTGFISTTVYDNFSNSNPSTSLLSGPICTFQASAIVSPDNNGFCGVTSDYAVLFRGVMNLASSGPRTFATTSDDGSALFINGNLVVNNYFFQGMTRREGTVDLNAGLHEFELLYFQGGGGSGLTAEFPSDATFVPEPSTSLLTLAGLAGALLFKRR
ncbi:MAG: PEP-CTERM sorting domain-containing protein [Bryobacterales bacterium]|nr:PEP-CTERM sorting domain-containing protein [Bryobacterales bacterium]